MMPRYDAKKVELDGFNFDSVGESKRYAELLALHRSGLIRDLKIHPEYDLSVIKVRSLGFPKGRRIRYTADFEYFDVERDEVVTEDYKGSYFLRKNQGRYDRLKMGIFEHIYGRPVRVVIEGGKSYPW